MSGVAVIPADIADGLFGGDGDWRLVVHHDGSTKLEVSIYGSEWTSPYFSNAVADALSKNLQLQRFILEQLNVLKDGGSPALAEGAL